MKNQLEPIDITISRFIEGKTMFVLRNKLTNQALNTSYSEEGLKFTMTANGRLAYFRDAKIVVDYDKNYEPTNTRFVGDLRMNPDVYVEKFIPTNHAVPRKQIAEYT